MLFQNALQQFFSFDSVEQEPLAKLSYDEEVEIKNKANNTGKIEIEYYSNEELEHIFDLLMSINNN